MNFELLPRLVPDAYVDTLQQAIAEVEGKRTALGPDAVVRFVKSRYGGFRVFAVSRRLAMEILTGLAEDGALTPGGGPASRGKVLF
jgi:hypothetical protein